MSLLRWIIGIPLVIGAILFAVANGETVSFYWSPLNDPLEWPLYAIALAALVLGFVLGSLMTWAAGHPLRKDRAAMNKTVKQLQTEIDKLGTLRAKEEAVIVPEEKDIY